MEPTKRGRISIDTEDGDPIIPAAGSSFLLDSGLLVVFMTQEDFNRWDGTR